MTTITINKTSSGEYDSFFCIGHTGYAESGSDIICSAISILVINTINSIETLTDEVINVVTDEGNGLIQCEFNEHPSSDATLLVNAMILGITGIEKQYGKKYLKLKIQEV